MIRKTVLAAMICALATPALATPPLPATAVVLSTTPDGAEASQRLVAKLASENWFGNSDAGLTPALFETCEKSGDGAEACIRAILTKRGTESPYQAMVAVLVAPGPDGTVTWTCLGEDVAKARPAQRTAPFDPALAIDMVKHNDLFLVAGRCVTGAGNEKHW